MNNLTGGIFAGLKQLSPNLSITTGTNEIDILIPKEDILEQLRKSIPDNIRNNITVEYTDKGVLMKVRLI